MPIDDVIRDHTLAAEARLTASLIHERLKSSSAEGYPRLIDVKATMVGAQLEDADFTLEIAPDMTMLGNFYAPVHGYDLAGNERMTADLICGHAIQASLVAADLTVKVADMASCANSLVAEARREGMPVRLVGIHVAEFGLWVEPHDVQILVTIETLGHNLRLRHSPFLVGSEDALRREFETETDTLAWRIAALERLRAANADGRIDLLSLNAIARFGAVLPTLQSMIHRDSMNLNGQVELLWEDGALYSRASGPQRLAWSGNILTCAQFVLPETACVNAVGRPITDLMSHFALTSDIKIRSVTNLVEADVDLIRVVLDVPEFFFSVDTGAVWPVP